MLFDYVTAYKYIDIHCSISRIANSYSDITFKIYTNFDIVQYIL